jgi:hypothetical protein
MSNFFVEQGRTRFFGEAYSMYVTAGKQRRTPLGEKRPFMDGYQITNKPETANNGHRYQR